MLKEKEKEYPPPPEDATDEGWRRRYGRGARVSGPPPLRLEAETITPEMLEIGRLFLAGSLTQGGAMDAMREVYVGDVFLALDRVINRLNPAPITAPLPTRTYAIFDPPTFIERLTVPAEDALAVPAFPTRTPFLEEIPEEEER